MWWKMWWHRPGKDEGVGLSSSTVRGLRTPGKYADGNGLYLIVQGPTRRSWTYRYQRSGRRRSMGLGSAEDVSLTEARERATEARKLLASGIDPLDDRKAEKRAAEQAAEAATTFETAANAYIEAHQPGWKNGSKSAGQWRASLATHAYPIIGRLPVAEIGTGDVLRVLEPIWTRLPETASRIRSRIEQILSYSEVRGWRESDRANPATWRGRVALLLPKKTKVRAVVHHAALDWRECPAFMARLQQQPGMGARALEFAILTAARSGEVRGATWDEIDFDAALWTVPAERMKAARPHRQPLSEGALAVLRRVQAAGAKAGLIFPGAKADARLSDMTLTAVLRRMGRSDLTAHGFRSSFRDFAGETTSHPSDIIEMALAHQVGSAVQRAYARSDLLEKRRRLMIDWGTFLASAAEPANVVPIRARAVTRM
jgi:integrase